ncbi:unnamed protein product [Cuscuta europaea]|uniref:Transposase (putative) gypsy type domain-containing protein n=1 Tax=Cuscuta europaea TaxID=41803 RepID=A0A9P0YZT5_CUSEU|nr:unnamed protein product [Cuscuta europaea]
MSEYKIRFCEVFVADEGVADEGTAEEGTAEEGVADEGTADKGVADEGTAEEGTADEGTRVPWLQDHNLNWHLLGRRGSLGRRGRHSVSCAFCSSEYVGPGAQTHILHQRVFWSQCLFLFPAFVKVNPRLQSSSSFPYLPMACSMEISSSSETSSGSSTGSSAGSSSASESRSRSSAEASGSDRSSASSMAVPDAVTDAAIPVVGEHVDMAVAMAAQPAAAVGHLDDYDSGEDAEEGDDLRMYKRGIPMDDHRHIVLIPNVAAIEQVFSKRALRELQVLLPPPAYYSLRGADNLFMRRPGIVMVHMDSLKAGLRFPLHPFYLDFFEFYGVVPAQFMPNSYRQISVFLVLCKSLGSLSPWSCSTTFSKLPPRMLMGS